VTVAEAEAHTRKLATTHYENFHVVSFLLPKHLHQDFYNVYAYCRSADDLADEIPDTEESLRQLHAWGGELDRMYAGEAEHPVFVALKGTVAKYGIPKQPFADLIRAFVQDRYVSRYQTWDEVLDYCVYSANPVGRLVLYLCGYSDAERQALSDNTCTALQLANFWQDITVDQQKDRVYLPLDLLAKHNYTVDELFAHKFDERFVAVMREAVDRARELFVAGLPLNRMVNKRLAVDLELFSRGGMCVLDKIEQQGYDVLSRRPKISKVERVTLLVGTLARVAFAA
jgi:squalene synthase HpnC